MKATDLQEEISIELEAIQLFDEEFASILAPYRRFRHVVLHSYGFQIEWDRMRTGADDIDSVYSRLRDRLEQYLGSLDS